MTDDILERYLGDMAPEEFESDEEVLSYFSLESLRRMFPGEDIDQEEAMEAMEYVRSLIDS